MRQNLLKIAMMLSVLICSNIVIAQPPAAINYQSLAKDPMGNPAKNRDVYLKIAILQTSPISGAKVWEETHVTKTDNDGVFTILIGKGTKSAGIIISDIGQINWGNGPFFFNIKVAVAPSIPAAWWVAADNYLDMGTTQMMSVPYAMYAGNASVTNVTTSLPPGPPNTFLITDSLGNVNWQTPQSANVSVTQISNNVLQLTNNNNVIGGQNAIIAPNSTTKIKMNVPGANLGDLVYVCAMADYVNFNIYSAWVSAKDEVSIRFANFQDKEIPVAGNLYKVVIIK